MTRRRPPTAPVVVAAIALVAALSLPACGGGSDRMRTATGGGAPTTTAAGPGTTGATAPPGTVAPDAPGVDLQVTFLTGVGPQVGGTPRLATAHRRVAPTSAVARAALEQLLAGPTPTERALGYASSAGAPTAVTAISIADGTATVVLDPGFGRGYDDTTLRWATAQIVFTLTQFPTVRAVRFGADGPPLTRADFRDLEPLVFVERPGPGERVSSPITVAGEANVFEATVRITVLGASGRVLADTFTTATAGTGTWGTFSTRVAVDPRGDATGTVRVFWDSPKDGSPRDVVEIPVRFS